MFTLYYMPHTISVASAIALEEAGLPYEAAAVDFASGAQRAPEYLAINPKGRVPALITPAGQILTETGALLEYIAACAPGAHLMPQDPLAAAHVRAVNYYLASTMHVAHAHKLRGARWADREESFADMRAKVPQTMRDCAAYVQSDCLRGDYVLGDSFSIADPYLYVVCSWLEGDGVPLADFPAIAAFMDRMNARPSLRAIQQKEMI